MGERQTVFGIDARVFAVASIGGALTLVFGVYTSFIAFQRDITAELRIRSMALEKSVSRLESEVERQRAMRSAINELSLNVFLLECTQEKGTVDVATLTCIRPSGAPTRFRSPFPEEERHGSGR